MIYYHKSFHDFILSGASVATVLQISVSTMLLLVIVRNYKVQSWDNLKWRKAYTTFCENSSGLLRT